MIPESILELITILANFISVLLRVLHNASIQCDLNDKDYFRKKYFHKMVDVTMSKDEMSQSFLNHYVALS